MKRTARLAAAAVLLSGLACGEDRRENRAQPIRPNLLLFITDQERPPMDLPDVLRPNLDRLAETGIVFENSFVSYPLCSPARASLLTGLHPHQAGVLENVGPRGYGPPLDSAIPNLGSVFAGAGYATGYFGKWHLSGPGDVARYGFSQVFVPANETLGRVSDPSTVARAAAWIRDRREPWLAIVSVINPHDAPYAEYFEGVEIPDYDVDLPPSYRPDPVTGQRAPELRTHSANQARSVPGSREAWLAYLRRYCFLLEEVDRLLGVVLDAVEDSGQAADTVVVYTSDHGEMAGHHGLWQKRVLYEPSIRVPLVVSYARLYSERNETAALASSIDVAPTLADLAGVEWPTDLPGRSLRGALSGPPEAFRDAVFAVSNLQARSVPEGPEQLVHMLRTSDWKYIAYPSGAEQLFNLRRDPDEREDLGDRAAYERHKASLRKRLQAWVGETTPRPAAAPLDF